MSTHEVRPALESADTEDTGHTEGEFGTLAPAGTAPEDARAQTHVLEPEAEGPARIRRLRLRALFLLAQADRHDLATWEEIFRELEPEVKKAIWHVMKHYHVPVVERDDVRGDAVAALIQAVKDYDPRRWPSPEWFAWCRMTNSAGYERRKRWRNGNRELLWLYDDAGSAREFPDSEERVLQQRNAELDILLGQVLRDPRQRKVFQLRELEGYSAVEIAGMLGVTTKTVFRDLQKARQALLKCGAYHGLGPVDERSSRVDDQVD